MSVDSNGGASRNTSCRPTMAAITAPGCSPREHTTATPYAAHMLSRSSTNSAPVIFPCVSPENGPAIHAG